jgi:hypothetical protein
MYALIECPNKTCGNKMSVEPGEVDYNLKDNDGKPMSKQAAKHYAF